MSRSIEGSVYRSGDRWFARLRYTDADGRRREKKRTCKSRIDANRTIGHLQAEIANEAAGRKTWRDLDKFFRRQYLHAARIVGGKKVSGYRQRIGAIEGYLDFLLAHFSDRFLDEITYSDLFDLRRQIELTPVRGHDRSVSSINHYLRHTRRLLNVAIEQGWLDVNPFKRGRSLIQNSFEVERTRILTRDEETRLLAVCIGPREHLKALVIFGIETACRRGEIMALRWSDVDLSRRTIRIDASNTKTLKERLVPVTARLRDTLAELRGNSLRPNSLVFRSGDPKRAFNTACRLAGLDDVHFHDLRHTGITRMLEEGISQTLVMKISGHSQMRTFLRYVNQTPQSIYDIAVRRDAVA